MDQACGKADKCGIGSTSVADNHITSGTNVEAARLPIG
jgi:hypothetical protein